MIHCRKKFYPLDRILIAQSQLEQLPILTIDQQISRYTVETIW